MTTRIENSAAEAPEMPAERSNAAGRVHTMPSPPAEVATSAAKTRRNPIPIVIAAVVVLAMAGFGVQKWLFGRTHVGTDNAQIQGDITPVLPKVGGFVSQILVKENQHVTAGQTLVVLDDRDLAAKLAQSEADLAAAQAVAGTGSRSGQAEAQLAAARATIRESEASAWKAHQDLARMRDLEQQAVVSKADLDQADAAARVADARLAAARDQMSSASAGVTTASAKVGSEQAARDQAALNLSYTRIVAPSTGVVGAKNVQVGQLVQVGQPLMNIVPLQDVWVVANLKETQVRNVAVGNPVEIRVDSYPGQVFHGTVESLSPASGARFSLLPPDNATGNFTKVVQRIPVRIHIDQSSDEKHVLRPGMSVTAVIKTG
jgi:membrane fusion protein (multidrug efflux system)